MSKIDIDKFVASLIEFSPQQSMKYIKALADQELRYKDGEIVEIAQECEDDRIRKELIKETKGSEVRLFETVTNDEFVAWLEKQGEHRSCDSIELKFNVGDWIIFNEHHNGVYQVERIDNYRYYLRHYLGGTLSVHLDNVLIRPWTIADAKDCDVLVYGDNPADHHVRIIMLFKSMRTFNSAFTHFHIFDDEFRINDWCDCGKTAHPATKEQRDLLFQKIHDEGYEWDADKKELKRLEKQGDKPQGKTALDAIHEEKMNNANKIMAKFKVGDWITNSIETVQITGYDIDYGYQVDYKGNLQHRDTDIIEKEYHLWTIQDAKDGDVLASQNNMPFIYNGHHDYFFSGSYCGISVEGKFKVAELNCRWTENVNIHPATKEQRDLLFQKMKEAGYEWDAEKKDLRKIENYPILSNSAKTGKNWSDEDEENMQHCCGAIAAADYYTLEDKEEIENWLKSLKQRWRSEL